MLWRNHTEVPPLRWHLQRHRKRRFHQVVVLVQGRCLLNFPTGIIGYNSEAELI